MQELYKIDFLGLKTTTKAWTLNLKFTSEENGTVDTQLVARKLDARNIRKLRAKNVNHE